MIKRLDDKYVQKCYLAIFNKIKGLINHVDTFDRFYVRAEQNAFSILTKVEKNRVGN